MNVARGPQDLQTTSAAVPEGANSAAQHAMVALHRRHVWQRRTKRAFVAAMLVWSAVTALVGNWDVALVPAVLAALSYFSREPGAEVAPFVAALRHPAVDRYGYVTQERTGKEDAEGDPVFIRQVVFMVPGTRDAPFQRCLVVGPQNVDWPWWLKNCQDAPKPMAVHMSQDETRLVALCQGRFLLVTAQDTVPANAAMWERVDQHARLLEEKRTLLLAGG